MTELGVLEASLQKPIPRCFCRRGAWTLEPKVSFGDEKSCVEVLLFLCHASTGTRDGEPAVP